MLEKLFKLTANKTSVKTEVIAGVTTFMTMAYILFLNPNILSSTGMDKNAVFFATAISAGLITIAMGLVANFPIALAPRDGHECTFRHRCNSRSRYNAMESCLGRCIYFRDYLHHPDCD